MPHLNVRIDAALNRELEHACTDRGVSKQAAVIQALQSWLQGAIPTGVGHSPDTVQNSAGLLSADGPSASVSPEQVRQILDEYEARLLARLEAAARGRESRNPQPKRRGKAG